MNTLRKVVLTTLLACGSASAQQIGIPGRTPAPAQAAPVSPVTVRIAEQRIESALDEFAHQTGLQVVYSTEDVPSNVKAPSINGTFPPGAILNRLLSNSGLFYEFINHKTVEIRSAGIQPISRGSSLSAGGERRLRLAQADLDHPPVRIDVIPGEDAPDLSTTRIELEEIMVVGTHLRNHDPASPVIVLDSERLERGGYTSLEDVFRRLPQNLSSITPSSTDLGQAEFGDSHVSASSSQLGAASINLRGLGSRSTLVLINGRRKAASAQSMGGYTDISSIPLSQVERVEILSDGASAIYGADAVAGVVNIVLKKNYGGATLQARREESSSGADVSRINGGYTLSWGSGSLTSNVHYEETKPADTSRYVHVGPRGIGDFTDLGGVSYRRRGIGQPGVVYAATELFPGFWGAGDPMGMVPGGQNGTALRPDDLIPIGTQTVLPSVYERRNVGPEVEMASARLNGEQQIGERLTLSFGAGYTRQKNSEHWEPDLFDFNFLQAGRFVLVPVSNPYNPFGQDVLVGYSFAREFSEMMLSNDQEQENYDIDAGLSGPLPGLEGWRFDLHVSHGVEQGESTYLGDLTGFGSGDASDFSRVMPVLNGLNVFGDGSDPQVPASNRALLQTLVERDPGRFESDATIADAVINGDLFTLPGGPAQIAIGAQYRNEKYARTSMSDEARSERDVAAVFTELALPLLAARPGVHKLTLTLAARHEKFEQHGISRIDNWAYTFEGVDLLALGGFDIPALTGVAPSAVPLQAGPVISVDRTYDDTSPQVRLAWSPVADLRLRATWGKSFLTPQPQQQFGRLLANNGTFFLTIEGGELPPGVDAVAILAGPNPNLKPQEADVLTYGFDYTPAAAKDLRLSATYNRTEFDNYIGDPTAGIGPGLLLASIDSLPEGLFVMGDNGVMLWDAREINYLGRRSESVDLSASYRHDSRWGTWKFDLNAVRTLELVSRTLPSLPEVRFSDTEFGPSKWAGNFFLGWERGGFYVSSVVNYASGHRVLYPLSASLSPLAGEYQDGLNPNPRRHAESYTTLDLQLGYRSQASSGWLTGVDVQLGAQNALDEPFPFVDNEIGFLANRVNVRGRVLYLDARKQFRF